MIARRGLQMGSIDESLEKLGLARNGAAIVSGFSPAIALARASDLIATVPERHTGSMCEGMHRFTLPLHLPDFTISLFWHPRVDADLSHRWLRSRILDICSGA